MVYYPKPLHLQTAFADPHVGLRPPQDDKGTVRVHQDDKGRFVLPQDDSLSFRAEPQAESRNLNLCPVATSLCSRVLSLPLHPYITEEQIDTVCNAIRKVLR